MTKAEVLAKLKEMFIEKFGANKEVSLNEPIEIYHSWDVGSAYMTKIRYNGKEFEYYKDYWSWGWKNDQSVFNRYALTALSDCLGVKVKTKTEYFID